MMEFLLVGILLAAVFAFIAYPILYPSPVETLHASRMSLQNATSLHHESHDALYAERDAAYAALRDLDFDFQLGKLSQRDYDALRERYKTRAALALQQIDAISGDSAELTATKETTDPIEREIARLRAAKQNR